MGCSRKPWKDGFCKQHHPDTVKAYNDARHAKWKAKWDTRDAANAKTLRIESLKDAVLQAAEVRADAGLCGCEDATQRASHAKLAEVVDALREARK
jgi:hypothetical protein